MRRRGAGSDWDSRRLLGTFHHCDGWIVDPKPEVGVMEDTTAVELVWKADCLGESWRETERRIGRKVSQTRGSVLCRRTKYEESRIKLQPELSAGLPFVCCTGVVDIPG